MKAGRIVAVLLLVAAVGLAPGVSTASSHECGGAWTFGHKCELTWNGAPATGTGTAAGTPVAFVDVRLTDSHGNVLGSCSDTGLLVASCSFSTTLAPASTLPLICYVNGSVAGTYACEG